MGGTAKICSQNFERLWFWQEGYGGDDPGGGGDVQESDQQDDWATIRLHQPAQPAHPERPVADHG